MTRWSKLTVLVSICSSCAVAGCSASSAGSCAGSGCADLGGAADGGARDAYRSPCPGREITFEDGDFASNWTSDKIAASDNAYRVEMRRTGGAGDGGAFLFTAMTVAPGTSLWVAHEQYSARIDLKETPGASIHLSVAGKVFGGQAVWVSPLVRRGQTRYWTPGATRIARAAGWVGGRWTADMLVPFPQTSGVPPDLADDSEPLWFGVVVGASGADAEVGIDDWRVAFCRR